jgi:hypothetical protein
MQAAESLLYNDARVLFHDADRSNETFVGMIEACKRLALASDNVRRLYGDIAPPRIAENFHRRIGMSYSLWNEWAWSLVGALSDGDKPSRLMAQLNEAMAAAERARIKLLMDLNLDQSEVQLEFNRALDDYMRTHRT